MRLHTLFRRFWILSLLLTVLTFGAYAQEAKLPASLQTIADEAFMGNSAFENVVLPDGLSSIGSKAFADCTALKTVEIPDSVTFIAEDAFDSCGRIAFLCTPSCYAAEYAARHPHIRVGLEETYSVRLSVDRQLAEVNTPLSWHVSCEPLYGGEWFELIIMLDGEEYCRQEVRNLSETGNSVTLTLPDETGLVFAVCYFHHENGETTQLISQTTQLAGKLSATLTLRDPTAFMGEAVVWDLHTTGAAGIPAVQYSVYSGETLLAQSGQSTASEYRHVFDDAGDYSIQALITDGLGRECIVQGDSVTVLLASSSGSPLSFQLNADGESYTVVDCDVSVSGRVDVPSVRYGRKVTAIGDGAFMMCENITYVDLPSSVTAIGDYAFHGCRNLETVYYTSNMTSLGEGAFSNCPLLETSFTLPAGMTEVPPRLLEGSGITAFTIPSGVVSIGENAFASATHLTSISLPATLRTIGSGAFSGCSGLASISFQSAPDLMENAFASCTGLRTLVLPEGMTTIGDSAFVGCSGLNEIVWPSTLSAIGERAFASCTGLRTLTLPSSLSTVGASAFAGCTGLNTVTFENINTSLGKNAFAYCPEVELHAFGAGSVTDWAQANGMDWVNTSVPQITSAAAMTGDPVTGSQLEWRVSARYGTAPYSVSFSICCNGEPVAQKTGSGLAFSHIPENAGNYHAVITVTDAAGVHVSAQTDSVAVKAAPPSSLEYLAYTLSSDGTTCTITGAAKPMQEPTELVIPAEIEGAAVTQIAKTAFVLHSDFKQYVTSLVIPDSVTSIGDSAFSNFTALETLTLGSGLTSIGKNAFYGCRRLKRVTVPSSVTACGALAFADCSSMTEAVWNASMVAVPESLFAGCDHLANVKIGYPIEKIERFAFSDTAITTLEGLNHLTSIGQGAFDNCTQLLQLSLMADANFMYISSDAFQNCTSLQFIRMADETICVPGDDAFANCISLSNLFCKAIRFSSYALNMDWGSNTLRPFTNCSSLKEAYIIGNVPKYAFQGCTSLETVTLDNVYTVYTGAFQNCTALKELQFVDIPYNGLVLEGSSFQNCTALQTVVIPDGMSRIGLGAYAFEGCTGLTKFHLPVTSNAPSLSKGVFQNCTALRTVENINCIIHYPDAFFKNCSSLEDFDILHLHNKYYGSYQRELGDEVFVNCESLTSMDISGFMYFGENIFSGCSNLVLRASAGTYGADYLAAHSEYQSPHATALTTQLSAELEWGSLQANTPTIAATVTVYNTKGGMLPIAGDWTTAFNNARMHNITLDVSYSYCMEVEFPEGNTISSLNYQAGQPIPLLLTCTSKTPSTCTHGSISFELTADDQSAVTFYVAATEVQFPNVCDGDLVITTPTTLDAKTLVHGNVYVRNVLTMEGGALNCDGNVYVEEGGTLRLNGSSGLSAASVDIQSGGALELNGRLQVTADTLTNAGSLAILKPASTIRTERFSVTGSGVLNLAADGRIDTDTFVFNTSADHSSLLTNGVISACTANLQQNFRASRQQVFALTGSSCNLAVKRTSPLQQFASLVIDCPSDSLTIENISILQDLPFEAAHFAMGQNALGSELKACNTVAKEIYDKFTAARLEEIKQAEKKLDSLMEEWYSVSLNLGNLDHHSEKQARQISAFAQKAAACWALETAADSPGSWSNVNDVFQSIHRSASGGVYTFEENGVTYEFEVKPLSGLSVSTAAAGAGTIVCKTGGKTYTYTFALNEKGIRESSSELLAVLRTYAEEEFVKHLNKALEEAFGKENVKYALAIVKVAEESLIKEKTLFETIADMYGKDIAKKLIEQQFPKLKKVIGFFNKWEKFIKQTDKVESLAQEVRTGKELPTSLLQEFLKLEKLVP